MVLVVILTTGAYSCSAPAMCVGIGSLFEGTEGVLPFQGHTENSRQQCSGRLWEMCLHSWEASLEKCPQSAEQSKKLRGGLSFYSSSGCCCCLFPFYSAQILCLIGTSQVGKVQILKSEALEFFLGYKISVNNVLLPY